jgi:chromosome segregation ATPase
MSNLNALLNEAEKTNERLKDAITGGNYDAMCSIEKSQVELSRRIYFARRDDIAERLNDLRIEKDSVAELQSELADELTAQAAVVMDAKSKLYDAQTIYSEITAKQYFLSNQAELCRKKINETTVDLDRHIKSRLNTVSGSKIDLMENDICEILPN